MSLGGSILAYNCLSQDYCLAETLACLASVCDQISISVCKSNDGTNELVEKFATDFGSECLVHECEWKPEGVDGKWLHAIRDYARSRLGTDMHLLLDADELIHENKYDLARNTKKTQVVNYYNFWRDGKRYVSGPTVYACNTVRIAPTHLPLIFDGGSISHHGTEIPLEGQLSIYHYGFVKKPECFLTGKKRFQMELSKIYDPDFDLGINEFYKRFDGVTIPFKGTHPMLIQPWLVKRSVAF